ncbi:MAPEG family protein [Pseudoxanthomonas dokdonensis]|uniref:MAPEG family protein n=1 Tax=Pseudoxanthomonas dokdonensis TaxID=344882 RepID=A0A0R0CQ29_9GAMM|nr:MAPEG family protein [Pseudoxanthomonas dokdonensis]KRG68346.1 hypothetical protein ABB29_13585 [Pseudoxanthomonas dokdonensis]
MSLAYWCILIAALLPYVWISIAKASGKHMDNRDPRGWIEKQHEPRVKRAHAAQLNAFEALPAFVAGVLMAQLAGVPVATINLLALVFVVARVLHGVMYIANLDKLRSLAWFVGLGCVLALMIKAALALG